MRTMRWGFVALASLVLNSLHASADSAKANAYLDEVRATGEYPGVSAAIAVDGTTVWAGGSGFADVAAGVEAKPSTVYRLGSVSKMLTIAAVALLVQEGKLDLDIPVQQYVPEYPVKDKGTITTRLLAGHLAGIPHYMAGDKQDTERPNYDNVVAAIAEYRDKPQLFEPGTRYRYSTYGYSLISAVVERAGGMAFPEYLRESVFAPLGMASTRVERAGETVSEIATFYDLSSERKAVALPPMYLSYKWAGGGMLSSVDDLVRFGSAWLPGSEMFKPETLALVFTSQKTADGKETGVGLGWRIDTVEKKGRAMYHHGGAIEGGRSFLAVFPDEKTVVAILGNMLPSKAFDQQEAVGLLDAFRQ